MRRLLPVALLALSLAAPPRLAAQTCVGDCSGAGEVSINDLILAVNIVLEQVSPDACPALGAPPIGIAQLVASVSNALCACQPCPTAPPSPTPSATPPPSATPTASATPTYVVSKWREDQFRVTSTDCPANIAKRVRESLKNAVENYTVQARGRSSRIEDQYGNQLPATIDADGLLYATYTTAQQQGNCNQIYTQEWTVDLRQNPSVANYTGVFRTAPCAKPVNCTQTITSRWVLKSGTPP
ncbi:MAG: hypothetical protein SF182_29555 [Deltaproteobacteria bacterium]|nr:hypothetical protein [Deltaproteobacteria bacterium]